MALRTFALGSVGRARLGGLWLLVGFDLDEAAASGALSLLVGFDSVVSAALVALSPSVASGSVVSAASGALSPSVASGSVVSAASGALSIFSVFDVFFEGADRSTYALMAFRSSDSFSGANSEVDRLSPCGDRSAYSCTAFRSSALDPGENDGLGRFLPFFFFFLRLLLLGDRLTRELMASRSSASLSGANSPSIRIELGGLSPWGSRSTYWFMALRSCSVESGENAREDGHEMHTWVDERMKVHFGCVAMKSCECAGRGLHDRAGRLRAR